jgi:hypothetical protein
MSYSAAAAAAAMMIMIMNYQGFQTNQVNLYEFFLLGT